MSSCQKSFLAYCVPIYRMHIPWPYSCFYNLYISSFMCCVVCTVRMIVISNIHDDTRHSDGPKIKGHSCWRAFPPKFPCFRAVCSSSRFSWLFVINMYLVSGISGQNYYVCCPVDPGSIQGSHWPISLTRKYIPGIEYARTAYQKIKKNRYKME